MFVFLCFQVGEFLKVRWSQEMCLFHLFFFFFLIVFVKYNGWWRLMDEAIELNEQMQIISISTSTYMNAHTYK